MITEGMAYVQSTNSAVEKRKCESIKCKETSQSVPVFSIEASEMVETAGAGHSRQTRAQGTKSAAASRKNDNTRERLTSGIQGGDVRPMSDSPDGDQNICSEKGSKTLMVDERRVRSASDSRIQLKRVTGSRDEEQLSPDYQDLSTAICNHYRAELDFSTSATEPIQRSTHPGRKFRSFSLEKPAAPKYLYPSPIPIFSMEESFPPVDF